MANQVLAKISWLCMVLHILANLTSAKDGPVVLCAMQVLGVLTSIWNQSVTGRTRDVARTLASFDGAVN